MFKLLELYENKITVNILDLDKTTCEYLTEFKTDLNKHIAEEREKLKRKR